MGRIAELLAEGLTTDEIVALSDIHQPRLHGHIGETHWRALFDLRLIEMEPGGAGVRLTALGRDVVLQLGNQSTLGRVA